MPGLQIGCVLVALAAFWKAHQISKAMKEAQSQKEYTNHEGNQVACYTIGIGSIIFALIPLAQSLPVIELISAVAAMASFWKAHQISKLNKTVTSSKEAFDNSMSQGVLYGIGIAAIMVLIASL
jgi:hypothetical protein